MSGSVKNGRVDSSSELGLKWNGLSEKSRRDVGDKFEENKTEKSTS